jgi:endonuclease YncB( thermonuclease family)
MSVKKIISTFLLTALVLSVVFLDPKGDVLAPFSTNFKKTWYFEHCKADAANQGVSATSGETALLNVVDVVDGDTIHVSRNCKMVTIRLIGINTPESVDPRRPIECFGIEASRRAKKLLSGQQVRIETDPAQGKLDKYGRTLGYVIMADGTNFNELMVREGYAYEYTYGGVAYRYQKQFKDDQKAAQAAGRGLWSASTCNGKK